MAVCMNRWVFEISARAGSTETTGWAFSSVAANKKNSRIVKLRAYQIGPKNCGAEHAESGTDDRFLSSVGPPRFAEAGQATKGDGLSHEVLTLSSTHPLPPAADPPSRAAFRPSRRITMRRLPAPHPIGAAWQTCAAFAARPPAGVSVRRR